MKISIIVMALLISNMAAAKIYTWNDEKGNPVFSNVPPKQKQVDEFRFNNLVNADLELLEFTNQNVAGKWKEISNDGSYRALEFNDPNKIVIFQYDNDNAFYKGEGTWTEEEKNLHISLSSTINQKSNFRSQNTIKHEWFLESLTTRELAIVIDGETLRFAKILE